MRDGPINRLETAWPQAAAIDQAISEEQASWNDRLKAWESNLESFMTGHPRLALATAAAVGLALGWMVKRK